MGASEIQMFLTDLAVHQHVSGSTQNQAFHALLFLYQQVLHMEVEFIDATRAKTPKKRAVGDRRKVNLVPRVDANLTVPDTPCFIVSWPDIDLVLHGASSRQISTMWQLPDVAHCLIGMASRAKRFLISNSFR